MRSMFGGVVPAGLSRHSKNDRRATECERVQALCAQIQIAIYLDDRPRVDDLMCELALATADEARVSQPGLL